MDKKSAIKTSLRFFDDVPVRSVWDAASSSWWMCAADVVAALVDTTNERIYWATVKRRNAELFADCKQLKMTARDGKMRKTDVISDAQIASLLSVIRSPKRDIFREWLDSLSSSVDERSREKAYELYENGIINDIEVGTVRGLQQIHAYIFGGLYDFAGQIRNKNISKGGFMFAAVEHLPQTLAGIDRMADDSFEHILDKYVEMNIAHPFMEGNGRSTRIWLDMILKRNLKKCVDWSLIGKQEYMSAMKKSPTDATDIIHLIRDALTDKIDDRELFMKGIDYSYYYEYSYSLA